MANVQNAGTLSRGRRKTRYKPRLGQLDGVQLLETPLAAAAVYIALETGRRRSETTIAATTPGVPGTAEATSNVPLPSTPICLPTDRRARGIAPKTETAAPHTARARMTREVWGPFWDSFDAHRTPKKRRNPALAGLPKRARQDSNL